MVSGSSDSQ